MKALAYFTALVEEPPCLALPFQTIRQYIKADSIVLEGDDGEEYRARLFSRSKSSDNVYVAAGWSKFEHAHGIAEGDVLFCKLLPGPKLKITVAERNGEQHSDSTDHSSIGKIYKKRKIDEHTCSKKNMVQQQDSGSDSDSENNIIRKARKLRCSTRNFERPRKNQDQGFKKREETPGPCSKRKIDEHTCSKKNMMQDSGSGSDSDSQNSIIRKVRKSRCTRKVGRPRKNQEQSSKKREPCPEKEQIPAKIQAFASKIYSPYYVMELTTTKMNKIAVVPRDFGMHVNAANGSSVKLVVEGHKKHKVNWISNTVFQGFGKGWFDFIRMHNLKVGDYLVLEISGAKTIRVHIFYQSANQGKQEGVSSACKTTCKSEPCSSMEIISEPESQPGLENRPTAKHYSNFSQKLW